MQHTFKFTQSPNRKTKRTVLAYLYCKKYKNINLKFRIYLNQTPKR